MSRQLPVRPNLEYLRKEAKDLLEMLQRQDPSAQLADAQHALARAYSVSPDGETLTVLADEQLIVLKRVRAPLDE